jgi:cytoskeleton protein RodZ
MRPISVERLMNDAGMNEPIDPIAAAGDQQNPVEPTVPSPGAQLAALRKQRGWSIEDVASQLNLAPRQVQAIENDDYPALPGMAVARGFVRAYAKLLKVDPTPLLPVVTSEPALAGGSPATRRTVAAPFSEPRFREITDRPGFSGKHLAAAFGVVVVLAGVWVAHRSGVLSSVVSKLEGGLANISGAAGDAANPAPASNVAAPVESNPAPAVESSTIGTVAAQAVTPPVTPPTANAGESAAPQQTVQTAQTAGKDVLVLKARQDSWIEIKGPGNRTVLSRVVKAGETETLEVNEPLSVVIGNAAGVDATLRGEPVAMKSTEKNNIARLSLK